MVNSSFVSPPDPSPLLKSSAPKNMKIPLKESLLSILVPRRRLAILTVACLTAAADLHSVKAIDFSWDPSTTGGIQYGDGIWNSSLTNWTTNGGTSNTAWVNGTGNNAAFSSSVTGTAPALVTVTLGANISLQQLTMGGSYNANVLISGASNVLTFGGAAPLLSNNNTTKYLQIDAVIAGGTLQKTNSGTVILSQNNTYTNTVIQGNASAVGGILQIGNSGTTGSLGSGNIVIQQATGQTGASTLRFQRSDAVTVSNSITITDTANGGVIEQSGNNTLTLSGTQTLTGSANYRVATTAATSGQDAVVSGAITGAGNLTKSGAGTLVLTGTNLYSGTTAITAGTLLVNGDQSASTGLITVSSGATLGGTGTAGGATIVNGTLAPGSQAIGHLSIANVSLTSTSTLDMELGRSGGTAVSDSLTVNGSVSISTGANLKLTLYTNLANPTMGDIFYLVNNDGSDSISGVFTQLNGTATALSEGSVFTWNSQQWQITYQANFGTSFTGGNDIAIAAIPEPGTIALLGLGALLGMVRLYRFRTARC